MASPPSSPLLPAFGIRHLNGQRSPPGIVQITASQYDSTVHSQPDAVLSYVDLDDGEIITVGSSFELGQRLDEPALLSTLTLPVSPTLKAPREASENQMMHIFDIKRTSGSLATWREHEAYTSKIRRDQDTPYASLSSRNTASTQSQTRPDVSASQPHPEVNSTSPTQSTLTYKANSLPDSVSSNGASTERVSKSLAHEDISAHLDKALTGIFTGLEPHLGPLADLLDSAANGLRKLAEKTAKSDSTPVGDVLNGFRNIVTEVGELGLEFLATPDKDVEKIDSGVASKSATATPLSVEEQPSSLLATKSEEPPTQPKPQSKTEPFAKRVSFVETQLPTEQNPASLQEACCSPYAKFYPGYIQKSVLSASPPVVRTQPATLPNDITPEPRVEPANCSIMDSETSDSDFSIRYPPLPSLRKASSVGGLHDKTQQSNRHLLPVGPSSVTSRYPSLASLEEVAPLKLMSKSESKPATHGWSPNWSYPGQFKPKMTDVSKAPTVEDESKADPTTKVDPKAKVVTSEELPNAKWPPTSLPGAWPEQRAESFVNPPLPTARTLGSKAANHAPQDSTASTGDFLPSGLSHRISSPVSEDYSPPPSLPRKSQTVSGTNPAARLNGPFDPLAHIPVLQPRAQRSQPNLSLPKPGSTTTTSDPPVLPGVFPRRSQTVHHTDRYKPIGAGSFNYSRPTLWDNYLKNSFSSNAIGGPSSQPRTSSGDLLYNFPGYSQPLGHHSQLYPTYPYQPSGLNSTQSHLQKQPQHKMPKGLSECFTSPPQQVRSSLPAFELPPPSRVPAQQLGPRPMRSEPNLAKPPTVSSAPKPTSLSALRPTPLRKPEPVPAPKPPIVPTVASSFRMPPTTSPTIIPPPVPFTRPRGRSGVSPQPPSGSSTVDECIKSLKSMGFGCDDPNEMSRLNVYAGAAAGNIEDAIEMIEEDREAARELEESTQVEGMCRLEQSEDEYEDERNPWED